VLGNFTYNEIIEVKIFGINSHMSKYLDEEGNPIKSKNRKNEYGTLLSKEGTDENTSESN